MKKTVRILLFLIFMAGLIGVRVVEDELFYDPFLNYFRFEGLRPYPQIQWLPLILHHLLRYGLNVLCSCGIVYALFGERKKVKETAVLMLAVFGVVFPIYLWCLATHMEIGELLTFYIRRFVIQPILLLLIIPIFYFQKKKASF